MSLLGADEFKQRLIAQSSLARNHCLIPFADATTATNQGSVLVSTDTLVQDVHFTLDFAPQALGHKALAVNLSDIAAMGAKPAAVSLTFLLPQSFELEADWADGVIQGWTQLAAQYQIKLLQCDCETFAGHALTLIVRIFGTSMDNQVLRRSQAQIGDHVFVSGWPGEAAAGLACLTQKQKDAQPACSTLLRRLYYPTPRVDLGQALLPHANACIDVSDGLQADLDHVCSQSQCAARIELERLPVSAALQEFAGQAAVDYVLNGGDDYELCFTVAESHCEAISTIAHKLDLKLTDIGVIVSGQGVRVYDNKKEYQAGRAPFAHFKS